MAYTADTLDVLTQQEARDAVLGMSTPTVNDDVLSGWVTAVSRRLDIMCGPVVQRTVTSEKHSGGFPSIQLRRSPVTSISTVTEYILTTGTTLTAETVGTTPGTGYVAEPHPTNESLLSGRILRRNTGNTISFWPGINNIVVTYTAGRYADTASVDDRFKSAARLILRNIWRSVTPGVGKVGDYDVPFVNFPTYLIPDAVKRELLPDEVFVIPGIA